MTAAAVLAGDARWCVVEGDAAEVLATLPAASVHAVVTDPPSGIAFMGAEWDRDKGGRAAWCAWLAGILAHARAATVPGGRAFVWSLPRTSHWTGCAVEDAGWSIETTVQHLFGTGWPKGKSQLKPAAETWWLARTGPSLPLNVDACRVGTSKNTPASPSQSPWHGRMAPSSLDEDAFNPSIGRWPPNAVFSHGPGCVREGVRRVRSESVQGAVRGAAGYGGGVTQERDTGYADPDGTEAVDSWRCEPGCVVAALDAQAGERTSGVKVGGGYKHDGGFADGRGGGLSADGTACYGDTGGASRFFPQFEADYPAEVFRYVAKPSRAEKNAGCEGIPAELSNATGFDGASVAWRIGEDGARTPKAVRQPVTNSHPTVKPLALMRWLIRLVTKPGDIVLDPFGGSGTTGAAALLEGRRVILVERDPRYAEIARARLQHAAPTRDRLATMATAPVRVEAPDFGPLFGGAR